MPVDPAHRLQILEAVRDVTVDDFGRNFEPIYERAHQVLGGSPLRVDEEIRNALNHFRLAYDSEDFDAGMLDIVRARRHVYFAIYLCHWQMIEHELKLTEAYLGSPVEDAHPDLLIFQRRLAAVKKTRDEISKFEPVPRSAANEIEEDTLVLTALNDELERALLKIIKLYGDLRQEFPFPIETYETPPLSGSDRLQPTLNKVFLIEQEQDLETQISELESSIVQQREVLAREETQVQRHQIIFLVVASSLAAIFLIVGAWWARHPQISLLPITLLLAAFFSVSGFVLARISSRHKSKVRFESAILKHYLEIRLQLLHTRLASRNRLTT